MAEVAMYDGGVNNAEIEDFMDPGVKDLRPQMRVVLKKAVAPLVSVLTQKMGSVLQVVCIMKKNQEYAPYAAHTHLAVVKAYTDVVKAGMHNQLDSLFSPDVASWLSNQGEHTAPLDANFGPIPTHDTKLPLFKGQKMVDPKHYYGAKQAMADGVALGRELISLLKRKELFANKTSGGDNVIGAIEESIRDAVDTTSSKRAGVTIDGVAASVVSGILFAVWLSYFSRQASKTFSWRKFQPAGSLADTSAGPALFLHYLLLTCGNPSAKSFTWVSLPALVADLTRLIPSKKSAQKGVHDPREIMGEFAAGANRVSFDPKTAAQDLGAPVYVGDYEENKSEIVDIGAQGLVIAADLFAKDRAALKADPKIKANILHIVLAQVEFANRAVLDRVGRLQLALEKVLGTPPAQIRTTLPKNKKSMSGKMKKTSCHWDDIPDDEFDDAMQEAGAELFVLVENWDKDAGDEKSSSSSSESEGEMEGAMGATSAETNSHRHKRHQKDEHKQKRKQKQKKEREDRRHRTVMKNANALAALLPTAAAAPAQMPTALFGRGKACSKTQSTDPKGKCFKYDPENPPKNKKGEELQLHNGKWVSERQIQRHAQIRHDLGQRIRRPQQNAASS